MHLNARLDHFGPRAQGQSHQVLNRLDLLFVGNLNRVGRYDLDKQQGGASQAVRANGVLQQGFLQLDARDRQRQILFPGRHFGFSADDLDRGQGANFHPAFVVLIEPFGETQVFLPSFNIHPETDQVPVKVLDSCSGLDKLLLEDEIGNFPIVFGNRDVAGVDGQPEPLQQRVPEAKRDVAAHRRVEVRALGVGLLRPVRPG